MLLDFTEGLLLVHFLLLVELFEVAALDVAYGVGSGRNAYSVSYLIYKIIKLVLPELICANLPRIGLRCKNTLHCISNRLCFTCNKSVDGKKNWQKTRFI